MSATRRRNIAAGTLLAALLVAPVRAGAQVSVSGPPILGLEGVRAGSFGDALPALRAADAIFSNPGLVGVTTGTAVAVSRYGGASTYGFLTSSERVGRVGLAVGVRWLEFGLPGTAPGLSTGQLVAPYEESATDLAATATVSYPVKGIRVGASVTYAEERALGTYMGGLVADVGVFRDLGRVEVGVSAQHLGAPPDKEDVRYDGLPTRVRAAGVLPSVMVGTFFDLAATAMIGWEQDLGLAAGAGVELSYLPLEGYGFAIRTGFRRVRTDRSPHPWPLAIGATIGVDRFRVDLAVEPSSGGGMVRRLGLRIQ